MLEEVFMYEKEYNFGSVKIQEMKDSEEPDAHRVDFILKYGKKEPTEVFFRSWISNDLEVYPELTQELVKEIDIIKDFEWSINAIMRAAGMMQYKIDEARQRKQDERIIKGIQNLTRHTLIAEAIEDLKDVADDLYEYDEEHLALRVYEAILKLVDGEEMLPQFIQAQVLKEAENRGIELTHSQILMAVNSLVIDMMDGFQKSTEDILNKITNEFQTIRGF